MWGVSYDVMMARPKHRLIIRGSLATDYYYHIVLLLQLPDAALTKLRPQTASRWVAGCGYYRCAGRYALGNLGMRQFGGRP